MDNFNLKKYLAESKLLKEDTSEYKVGDKVKFNPSIMKDKGFENNITHYDDLMGVIEKVSQDELEIQLNKSVTPPGGGNVDGILLMKSEGDYEMLAEGKLTEGIWNIGNPDDIRDFIKKVNTLQKDYWEVVGSDTVMNGLDSAMDEAKILLDVKMGNVQPEEFDLEINENLVKENDKNDYANSEEDYTDSMVIEKIKDIIRYHELDAEDVMEEIGQEFGIWKRIKNG